VAAMSSPEPTVDAVADAIVAILAAHGPQDLATGPDAGLKRHLCARFPEAAGQGTYATALDVVVLSGRAVKTAFMLHLPGQLECHG
jgi:hypothetical protein